MFTRKKKSAFLEDNKVPASRAEVVTALYGNVKVILRQLLARNTSPWPHVTDVQWRLDYNVKVCLYLFIFFWFAPHCFLIPVVSRPSL